MDLSQFVWREAERYVFGLEISVDETADSVHVVESDEALLTHAARHAKWDTLVVVALDHFEQVDAHDFENHHVVLAVWPVVLEGVEQLDCVAVL